jgi:dipeptidyl aminopeptidase/acylaminoacyl peptidase
MKYRPLIALLVLVAVLASVAPVRAEVFDINPRRPPDPELSEAEALKLQLLQTVVQPAIQSDISPDDQTMMISTADPVRDEFGLAMLNIQDGSMVDIEDEILLYGPITERRWRDNDTMAYIALGRGFRLYQVTVDRRNGAVRANEIRLPGFPLSMAPDGYGLLMADEVELPAEESAGATNGAGFNLRLPTGFPQRNSLLTQAGWGTPLTDEPEYTYRAFADTTLSALYINLQTNERRRLLNLPVGSEIAAVAWSQDGTRLALVHNQVPAISRDGNALSDSATRDGLGRLAPEDNPFYQNNTLDIFNLDLPAETRNQATLRAAESGSDIFARISWSTDGRTLLALMQRPARLAGRENPIYNYPESAYLRFYQEDGNLLSTFDRLELASPFSAPFFTSPDEVFIVAPEGTNQGIYYLNRVSGEFRALPLPPGTVSNIAFSRLSQQVVYRHDSFTSPPELYRINWDGSAIYGLSFNNVELAAENQIRVDPVSFRLSNGAVRNGHLIQPAGATFPPRNVPIVVWQEGGPTAPMTNYWGTNVESPFGLLPNFGIAVLAVPLQGRLGLGAGQLNALADGTNFGQVDIDEQAAIARQMIRQGWTSSDQLGIAGCSYGGYFATMSIARHPDLYAAANTQCSLLDLFHEWQFGFTPYLSYLSGLPITAATEYVRDSPLYNTSRIRTPLLIFHGTRDFLPLQIAVNLHDQVEANGTPVKMLTFRGEGHGLGNPTSQYTAAESQIRWFREHLQTK